MSARQKWTWATALGLHFFVVIIISLQDLTATVAGGANLLPGKCRPWLERTSALASAILGKDLSFSNPFRQILAGYADCTGIEAGYSYFAPSVPGNSKLVFELHYPDGRVEYDVPVVSGAAAGYRISTLLDHLRGVHYVRLREALLQTLVSSIHRQHPDAATVRVVFGAAELTTPKEYRAGKRISYHSLYAYEFRYNSSSQSPTRR